MSFLFRNGDLFFLCFLFDDFAALTVYFYSMHIAVLSVDADDVNINPVFFFSLEDVTVPLYFFKAIE